MSFLLSSLITLGIFQQQTVPELQITSQVVNQGSSIQLNGQPWAGRWLRQGGQFFVEENWATNALGISFLPDQPNQPNNRQRAKWFSSPQFLPVTFATPANYRYVALPNFSPNWRVSVRGDTLQIVTPPAKLVAVRSSKQAWGDRLVVELDSPAPFQIQRSANGTVLVFHAGGSAELARQQFSGMVVSSLRLQPQSTSTVLAIDTNSAITPQLDTLSNPYRLVLDYRISPPSAPSRSDVTVKVWASGIAVIDQTIAIPNSPEQFRLHALEVDLKQVGLVMRPMWSNPVGMFGTSPLKAMAQLWQATAAINAGFFNRDRRLPVGAIRSEGQWLAGPALTRGAIAWNDKGAVLIDRLSYTEQLELPTSQVAITNLNSGYVQRGVARYTSGWGESYLTMTDNEILVLVQNNQITGQFQAAQAGQSQIPIPKDGYLLVLRGVPELVNSLAIGTPVSIKSGVSPASFEQYPHIIGAGPLLLKNSQIVLNPAQESFSPAFAEQRAVRSAIATTKAGKIWLVTVNASAQNTLPTLSQTAQVLQQLGAVDALNLDGGSSAGLYLGGNLLNRENTSAIHNAIGIFLHSPASR